MSWIFKKPLSYSSRNRQIFRSYRTLQGYFKMKFKITHILWIIFLISFCYCGVLFAQPNYYSPSNIYLFSEHLFQNGDYLRAAGEFQRYLFFPSTQNSDSIFFKIGLCYELSREPEQAINYYKKIINNYQNSNLFDAAHYEIANTYFQSGKYNESINYISNNIQRISSPRGYFRMNLLVGVNYLYQGKWETAHNHFSSLFINEPQDSVDSTLSMLNHLAQKGAHLSYKSPACAGLFSSLIPGMGKIYSGRINDGLYSLFVVGLTAWQAYDGFNKDGTDSIKGWIYGTFSTTFYLGNIYGSVVSVKLYNKKLEDNLINQIDIDLMWK
ncbi:tetratricopeptide repeat protein [candidate division KSB1 bacterium]|nr:tetratricopeptide repeat protein [candidate division KSB1 bacterium]